MKEEERDGEITEITEMAASRESRKVKLRNSTRTVGTGVPTPHKAHSVL